LSILNQIGYSGVNAAKVALNTTAQNIANSQTAGFSRLDTQFSSLAGSSALRAGGGVQVSSIRRLSNDFDNQQLWRATSVQQFHQGAQQYFTAVEQLMASDGSSISIGLDQLFAALSGASATPDSIALRQQIISEAGNLAQRFNGLGGNLQAQLDGLQAQRSAMVQEVNGLSGNIAELNRSIVEAQASGGDTSALRDQRDVLVQQLAQHAALRIHEDAQGALEVAFTNGQPLVAGNRAASLSVSREADGTQSMALRFAETDFALREDSLGGALGGLHEAEYAVLRPQQSALQDMASALAGLVNSTLAGGFDLNGAAGQPLFTFQPDSSVMLVLNPLAPGELALSSAAGEKGNNENLLKLVALKDQGVVVAGNTLTLNDAYATLLGQVASASRQNQSDLDTATGVTAQAKARRDSVSAVNRDEEAIALMDYQQAYQANMKVISTANQIFDELLAAF